MVDVVEEYVNEEKYHSDLLHQLINPNYPNDITGSGNQEEDYAESGRLGVNEFLQRKHGQLPKEIREEINHMQSECNFGLFPKLSRAWVTVDSNLFLWNFETNKDLAYYDAISTTITKVELVNVKPGIFEDPIKYLLVVVTVEEIVLLAVSFVREQEGTINITRGFDDPATFLIMQEIHKMPLDGSIVDQICCTQDGRIFFSCEDALYELAYYFDMWNARVFKRVNLTKGFMSALTSMFGSKDRVCQVACDDSRHILYTLSTTSKITVYDLGERGDKFSYVTSFPIYELQRNIGTRYSIDSELLKEIIFITVVPSTQSMYVNLIATLRSGYRAFFTCYNEVFFEKGNDRFSQNLLRPVELHLVHFRYSPMPIANFLNSSLAAYHTKSIDDITVIAFGSPSSNSSTTYALSTANFPYLKRLQETKEVLPLDQCIWSIEPSSARVFEREFVLQNRGDTVEIELVPSTQPKAYARQHTQPKTEFYVITAEGIDSFVHLKPVELLHAILEKFGPDSRQINTFLNMHGQLEMCVMALILMSNDVTLETGVKEMALRLFVTYGGQPTLVIQAEDAALRSRTPSTEISSPVQQRIFSSTPSRQSPAPGDLSMNGGRPLVHSTPGQHSLADLSHISFTSHGQPAVDGLRLRPSNRSRAIFTYFARIVYPIWKKRVCYSKENGFVTGIQLDEVREILRHVSSLRRVVEGYALFTGASHAGGKDSVQAAEALKQEKSSVKMLDDLMTLTQEYLALWQIILENNFNSTLLNLHVDLRNQLQNLTFSQLVALPETVGLDLISALIHYYLGDEAKTSAINERLANECPRLFTNDDANVLKATELIYTAKKASSVKERHLLVEQAVKLLKRHAKRVNLYEVSMLLRQVNYFIGIADLAIACANAVDPRGLALTAYHRRTLEAENEETMNAIKKREDSYLILIDALSYLHRLTGVDENLPPASNAATLSAAGAEFERDHVIDFILENNDELCHVALFRFLIDKQLEGLLIRKKNAQFERFITREIKATGDQYYLDLLWRYYKGTEDFAKAARLLYELATKPSRTVGMDKKMEFLSQALICVNSAQENPQNAELRQKIRDWLDVALVQKKIRDTIRSEPANTFEISALSQALKMLDENLLTLGDLLQIATRFELDELKPQIYECAGIKDGARF